MRDNQMKRITAGRLPAVPLITCDPYFSLWSGSDSLYGTDTCHWTGRRKRVTGTARIDGTDYRFMGLGKAPAMEQTELSVTATCTAYGFRAAGVELSLEFWTPLLLDDLDVMSRPCSYVEMAVRSLDGKPHEVELAWTFSGELCCDNGQTEKIGGGSFALEMGEGHPMGEGHTAGRTAWMGLRQQHPLGHSGDSIAIDWGYLYLAAAGGSTLEVSYHQVDRSLQAKGAFSLKETGWEEASLVAAYDDIASIDYFGRLLPGYWARDGETILDAIREAIASHDGLLERCQAFDQTLEAEAMEFGEAYTKVCIAAYRQSIAAHKLIADEQGRAVFISKECHSNGCAATVDVTYPSTPLFFCYNPELVRGMMRPIFRFAKLPVWGYDFAPHDAGRYPYVTGQVYGLAGYQEAAQDLRDGEDAGYVYPMLWQMPESAGMYNLKNQMPVEESGNMLILEAALVRLDPEGEREQLLENLPLYEKWVKYLLEYGSDPGEQLCTDDFAGHLAHNVNLAFKAIMGVEAYSILMQAAGRDEEAARYHERARAMAKDAYERASTADHTRLTFDGDDTSWSLKYNAVWDLIFGAGFWGEEFYAQEMGQYRKNCERYGVPLDSRESYTKSDWMLWAAAMDPEGKAVEEFSEHILEFLEESGDRVPFSDWYMTRDGRHCNFQNRTVQGGLFMPLLLKRAKEQG